MADFVKLDPPVKPMTLAEKFNERIQKAATKAIKNDDENAVSKNFLQLLNEKKEEEEEIAKNLRSQC